MLKIMRLAILLVGVIMSRCAFSEDISLSLPELSWSMEIAAPGFVVEEKEIAPSGESARLEAVNKTSGVILTAFLEKTNKKGDAKACREYYWNKAKKSPFKKEEIILRESGPMALVEYIVPEWLGIELMQKNLNAYLAEGDCWIDVHVSKAGYIPNSEDPFQSVLDGIRINHSFLPTAADYFAFGSVYYEKENYKKAITQYEKALELEKQKSSLPRNIQIVLIDQLGMSYGISGDLLKAQHLYECAITKEPDYPMFYYNLACCFAEEGHLDKAITNLQLAFKHKDKSLPGESVPNPRTDSSFKRYLDNQEFNKVLDQMR
jgi:tetratricopeptide (TPR) repeat protein